MTEGAGMTNEWMPIATLPKDGRAVDVWGFVWEQDEAPQRIPDAFFKEGELRFYGSSFEDDEAKWRTIWSPLYWRPLPTPPA
jgi:hypothetical protein